MQKASRSPLRICLAILLAFVSISLSSTASAEVDFTGKTLTVVVPFKQGGGTDVWIRFWGPLIADKLPGKPKIKVVNKPGGGGTAGANEFHKEAGEDGMLLLASSASVLYAYMLGDSRVEYDYNDWRALLASPTGGVVYADPEVLGAKKDIRLGNLTDKPWKLYTQGPTQLGLMLMLSLEVLGVDFEADFGAGGGMAAFESFRNGFYNIDMQTTSSYLTNVENLVEKGGAVPLFSFGAMKEGKERVWRDHTFNHLPTFEEFYRDSFSKDPSGPAYVAWKKFFLAGFPAQKMLIVPSNTEPEVIYAYERAILRVITETSNWPLTKDEVLGEYQQVVGEEADAVMKEATNLDKATLDWYKNWVFERFNIKI